MNLSVATATMLTMPERYAFIDRKGDIITDDWTPTHTEELRNVSIRVNKARATMPIGQGVVNAISLDDQSRTVAFTFSGKPSQGPMPEPSPADIFEGGSVMYIVEDLDFVIVENGQWIEDVTGAVPPTNNRLLRNSHKVYADKFLYPVGSWGPISEKMDFPKDIKQAAQALSKGDVILTKPQPALLIQLPIYWNMKPSMAEELPPDLDDFQKHFYAGKMRVRFVMAVSTGVTQATPIAEFFTCDDENDDELEDTQCQVFAREAYKNSVASGLSDYLLSTIQSSNSHLNLEVRLQRTNLLIGTITFLANSQSLDVELTPHLP